MKVVKFLEEGESIMMMEGVYKFNFLFIDDGVSGSDVFEPVIWLVGTV